MDYDQPRVPQVLTKRQQEVLNALKKLVKQNGCWPSFRDIQHELGYKSPNSVTQNIAALVRKGHLEKRGSYYDFTEESMYMTEEKRSKIDKVIDQLAAKFADSGTDRKKATEAAKEEIAAIIANQK